MVAVGAGRPCCSPPGAKETNDASGHLALDNTPDCPCTVAVYCQYCQLLQGEKPLSSLFPLGEGDTYLSCVSRYLLHSAQPGLSLGSRLNHSSLKINGRGSSPSLEQLHSGIQDSVLLQLQLLTLSAYHDTQTTAPDNKQPCDGTHNLQGLFHSIMPAQAPKYLSTQACTRAHTHHACIHAPSPNQQWPLYGWCSWHLTSLHLSLKLVHLAHKHTGFQGIPGSYSCALHTLLM